MDIAFRIVVGIALMAYGTWGLYRRQIGWSIGPLITTTITGIPGTIFSAACILGGGFLAVPLSVALLTGQPTNTLVIQLATHSGLPTVIVGLCFAILIQLALDLGGFIAWLRERSER